MKKYLTNYVKQSQRTPQNQPLNPTQVKNSAGGFVWEVSRWERLKRFLVLGSEGGSYYASEENLTAENAKNLMACILEDGVRVVDTLVKISDEGRAPKNDPAIFALAMVSAHGDPAARAKALAALPTVCRTATHLFTFVEFIKGMRGWGRGLRSAIAAWYSEKDSKQIAYQVIKYRNRNGWTHTDTLRKAHPKPKGDSQKALFQWITRRDEATWKDETSSPDDEALAFVWAFERVQEAKELKTVLKLIRDYDLPREALPTQWLNDAAIWEALLEKMPMTAMIRNLGNMAKSGLLKANTAAEKMVVQRLTDAKALRGARIHPIALLSALRVYGGGTALQGGHRFGSYLAVPKNKDWKPTAKVMDALDSAFNLAFKHIEPTNKRLLLAMDVSGSMDAGMIAGVAGLSPREGAGAMAMVTARTEPNHDFVAFSHTLVPLNISARMRLDNVTDAMRKIPMGATDCALPMIYAMENRIPVDAFVIYTDSESFYGKVHPAQALREYREKMGIMASLVVVAMVSNRFSIADPKDKGMLDVIGFDTAAPNVMADFIRGEI